MKRWIAGSIAVTIGFLVGMACSFGGGGSKPPQKYVRDAAPCACKPGCKCNHCSGEAGAKCYCNTGGCTCGAKMGKCACKHCTGVAGGDDGNGNCQCPK